GMVSVGADDDRRRRVDRGAPWRAIADARDTAFFAHDFFDRTALLQCGSGLGRRVDEELVEHDTARCVLARDALPRDRKADQWKVTEIEQLAAERRTVGSRDSIQQSPAMEVAHAAEENDVVLHHIAGEGGPV